MPFPSGAVWFGKTPLRIMETAGLWDPEQTDMIHSCFLSQPEGLLRCLPTKMTKPGVLNL